MTQTHQQTHVDVVPRPVLCCVLPHVLPRRMNDFKEIIKNKSIVDYLGIISRNKESLSINMELLPEQKCCYFSVRFVTQNVQNYQPAFHLPLELCYLINSYSSNSISLQFKIDYDMNYPFVTPTWSLLQATTDMTHLPETVVLTDYYQQIVDSHNGQYNDVSRGHNWTPAMSIHTDMINFILRILHFETITDYCD